MIDRKNLLKVAASTFGMPYLFGSKWDLTKPAPLGPVDCSGAYKGWYYYGCGIVIPEGSTNQHLESVKPGMVLPGDAGFLHTQDLNIEHHVGMVYDDFFMIEARGIKVNGIETGRICLHLRSEWEAREDFLGYFRPKAVVAIEGA